MPFEAAQFRAKVLDVIRLIPPGKVATYGGIARLAGFPNYSRHVGQVLRSLQDDEVDWAAQRRVQDRQTRREERRRRRRERREARRAARAAGSNAERETSEDAEANANEQGEDEAENADENEDIEAQEEDNEVPPAETPGIGSSDGPQPENEEEQDADLTVPWHRVLNHNGRVSIRFPRASMDLQALLLREEGVEVYQDGWGQHTVSLRRFGWEG